MSWLPLLGEIEACAKREDCSRARIFDRKGWLHLFDGYTQEHIIMDKDLG